MIRVLGDRVLVALRPAPEEIVSEGGLVLIKDPDAIRTPTQGVVMALGERTGVVTLNDALAAVDEVKWPTVEDGFSEAMRQALRHELRAALHLVPLAPFDVEVGDVVIFSRGAGDQFSEDGIDYVVLFESEILGVCEPLSTTEAA